MKKPIQCMVCLALIFILGLSSCRPSTGGDDPDDTVTGAPDAVQEREIPLVNDGQAAYALVYPHEASDVLIGDVNRLATRLEAVTGASFSVQTDRERIPGGKNELLIGGCNRDATKAVLSGLKYKDYAMVSATPHLVLAAHSEAYARKAIRCFIDRLSEENLIRENGGVALRWEGDYRYEATYEPSNVVLNGQDLSNYRIVYSAYSAYDRETAELLRLQIGESCGYVLDVVSDYTAESPYELLLGETSRNESRAFYGSSEVPGPMEYCFKADGTKFLIAGNGSFSTRQAGTSFAAQLKSSSGTWNQLQTEKTELLDQADFPDCTADLRFMTYNVLVEYAGWGSGGILTPDVSVRKEIVAKLILNYQPDILCLQEFFEAWRNSLPPMLGDDYEFICIDRENDGGKSNRTPLVYNKNRLKLIDSGYRDIGVISESDINRRVVTWAVLEIRQTGERFAVFGTHLTVENEAYRLQQIPMMAEQIELIRQAYGGIPAVAMGDFNTYHTGEAMKLFCQMTGMLISKDWFGVDHIYYTEGFEPVADGRECEKYTEYASDHKPIYADLNLKGNQT